MIQVVPTALFFGTPNIEEVYFYNNRIRMIGGRLVNGATKLKVAAFSGNPCTEISIYDGANIIQRLTTEFVGKCGVKCSHDIESEMDNKLAKMQKNLSKMESQVGSNNPRQSSSENNSNESRQNNRSM
jgi:hypothetical protein